MDRRFRTMTTASQRSAQPTIVARLFIIDELWADNFRDESADRLNRQAASRNKPSLMKIFLTALLAVLTLDSAAASEFSVRCEGGTPAGPYFATFDTSAETVVFESSSPNAATTDGNLFAGEISDSGDRFEKPIEFILHSSQHSFHSSRYTFTFRFNAERKEMIWPGLEDPFRQTLTHSCVITPPRSILSFRSLEPIGHPITVQCEETTHMYFTMDVDSKKVIFERGGLGSLYEGAVTSAEDDNINLLMNYGGTSGRLSWNRSRQLLTIEDVIGGAEPRKTLPCREIAPRTMIEYYKMLRR